ncbi:MAG TPA: ABC transporter substrate-binding protein [Nitrososphaeraceae archaeon]|jgi:branched-chain amino acid transport system substrate-binding protein
MVTLLSDIGFTKRILFFGVILATTIACSLIFFAKVETRGYNAQWILSITAAIPASLSVIILYQQKRHNGFIEKADLALAVALVLSLCATILWAVYEIILQVVPPVPSVADALSITAYAFLSFYVYSTYNRFYKVFHFSKKQLTAAVIASTIFLFFTIFYTESLIEVSSSRGSAILSIIIIYPVMDAIIMVPSFLIVVNYRKKPRWFTPWIFKSAGILLVVIGDSWFQLFVVTSLTTELWPSSMIFAASRVIIAAGLLWSIINFVPQRTGTNNNTNSSNDFDSSTRITSSEYNNVNGSAKAWSSNLIFVAITGLCIFTVILIIGTALSSSSIWSLIQLPLLVDRQDININTKDIGEASSSGDTVRLGALLPMSGVFSSSGKSTEAALRMALRDVNSNFSKSNSSLRYELVVQDTESDPTVSLEKLRLLAKDGIRIVIGPATSAELNATKDFADENGIILISPSSTAPTLAIEGDNVFRFVPDDLNQAKAISKIMWNQGISVVVPFWRNDVYGSELMRAVRANFQAMGGVFDKDAEKLGYAPRTGILASSLHRINFIMWENALKALESRLKNAISQYGIDKVGVYVVSYDEVTPIFIQANSHPVLSKVKWYGSDKSALNQALVRQYESASFAANTSFCNPISSFGNNNNNNNNNKNNNSNKDNGNTYNNFLGKIRKEIHTEPSPYSADAYDILRVAAIAENMTRHSNMNNLNNITDFQGIHDFRNAFIRAAKSYVGVTGNTTLDNMGDRANGEYNFWKVKASKTGDTESFVWIKTNMCK